MKGPLTLFIIAIASAWIFAGLIGCDSRSDDQKAQDFTNEDVRVVTINGHKYLRTASNAMNISYQHEASCYMHDLDSIMNRNRSSNNQ